MKLSIALLSCISQSALVAMTVPSPSMALLSVLVLLLSVLLPAAAHVTFSPNAGTSAASFVTAFRVPHGCDTVLSSGDAGPKVPTVSITAYIPNTLSTLSPLPGYVPLWPLLIVSSGVVDPLTGASASSWTWAASDRVGLPLGEFLHFPVSLTLPAVASGSSATLQVAVLQQCANISNLWGNTTAGASYPPPHITITNATATTATSSASPTNNLRPHSTLAAMMLLCVLGQLLH